MDGRQFRGASQKIFCSCVTVLAHLFGFGLRDDQKIVLSAGMATHKLAVARPAAAFSLGDLAQNRGCFRDNAFQKAH